MSTPSPLPKIQSQVLTYITEFIDMYQYPPTIAEITEHFDWSSKHSARKHIDKLVARGILTRTPKIARGLRLVKQEEAA